MRRLPLSSGLLALLRLATGFLVSLLALALSLRLSLLLPPLGLLLLPAAFGHDLILATACLGLLLPALCFGLVLSLPFGFLLSLAGLGLRLLAAAGFGFLLLPTALGHDLRLSLPGFGGLLDATLGQEPLLVFLLSLSLLGPLLCFTGFPLPLRDLLALPFHLTEALLLRALLGQQCLSLALSLRLLGQMALALLFRGGSRGFLASLLGPLGLSCLLLSLNFVSSLVLALPDPLPFLILSDRCGPLTTFAHGALPQLCPSRSLSGHG